MNTLFLLRHAKSSRDETVVDDHDRQLSTRGLQAAEDLAQHLRKTSFHATLVLCSTANRARQTFALIEPAITYDDLLLEKELYLCSTEQFISRLRMLNNNIGSALVIAHNPTLEYSANYLINPTKTQDKRALRDISARYPTGALAEIQLHVGGWKEITTGCGELISFVKPRDLPLN